MEEKLFGIRHHGPGSARCLLEALREYKPDVILLEGPPEADAIITLAAQETMEPPVALLTYAKDEPRRASFFPFAVFSPEWQAIQYALKHEVPIKFMDLPQAHSLAFPEDLDFPLSTMESDPLSLLARAAGYEDGERWWNELVEERRAGDDIFPAVAEAMIALRQVVNEPADAASADAASADAASAGSAHAEPPAESPAPQLPPRRDLREAYMRKTIRQAKSKGHQKAAIVCGAFHVPALINKPKVKEDNVLLKGLPKIKVETTWTPWTYDRLCWASGYGAGIRSPGWYHHLWEHKEAISEKWLTRVANLLRQEGLDASSAHIIEAVRLAETLAALRGRSIAGLDELVEAVQAVMCFGSAAQLDLIGQRLVVSNRLGTVPEETPQTPLQKDFQKRAKKLRLKVTAGIYDLDLDLRKPLHLQRSLFLHRLLLLDIPWGEKGEVMGKKKGSFHEIWQLEWDPAFTISLVEQGVWGTTVAAAAVARATAEAQKTESLAQVTQILELCSLAALTNAVANVVTILQDKAALSADVTHLMDALPRLVSIVKYGNVRKTDTTIVSSIIDGLVARICVSLPGACGGLNDEAAENMLRRMTSVDRALFQLEVDEYLEQWRKTLRHIIDDSRASSTHGLIAGRGIRLLFDASYLARDAVESAMFRALSQANEPSVAASWLQGFLQNSGTILIYDDSLLKMLDHWVSQMSDEHFTAVLPLLRRTVSTFEFGERRKLGEKVRHLAQATEPTSTSSKAELSSTQFCTTRAKRVLPTLLKILGGDEQKDADGKTSASVDDTTSARVDDNTGEGAAK